MRTASEVRETKETRVSVTFNIDGSGKSSIDTGIGFFNHMLTLFAFHGSIDLDIACKGDLDVDCHHTVEDIGLALGKAVRKALGDNPSIRRYGCSYVPMDDALSRTVVDISGRPYLVFNCRFPCEKTGELETETVKEFFRAFAFEARINLHMETLYGENTHHLLESLFKSFGRALSDAAAESGAGVPSTKGVL